MRCLRLGRHVLEGEHVVHAVGELDQDHPQVAGRSEDHLAEGLGLRLVAPHVFLLADLGHPVNQLRHVRPELLVEHRAGGQGVLQHIVQEAHRDAGFVQLEIGQDVGHVDRMGQVGLARLADLVLVLLPRKVVDPLQESPPVGPLVELEPLEDLLETHSPPRLQRRIRHATWSDHGPRILPCFSCLFSPPCRATARPAERRSVTIQRAAEFRRKADPATPPEDPSRPA